MKTIIAGGRDFIPTDIDEEILDKLRETLLITEVVCGMAIGADTFGKKWAESRGILVKEFPAMWSKFGRVAGMIRNNKMAEYADSLIAFPGGSGTNNMISIAIEKGLEIKMASWEIERRLL